MLLSERIRKACFPGSISGDFTEWVALIFNKSCVDKFLRTSLNDLPFQGWDAAAPPAGKDEFKGRRKAGLKQGIIGHKDLQDEVARRAMALKCYDSYAKRQYDNEQTFNRIVQFK